MSGVSAPGGRRVHMSGVRPASVRAGVRGRALAHARV